MHKSTKALMDRAAAACDGGPLCSSHVREPIEVLMAVIRTAQAEARECQDRARHMVADETDTTLRHHLEPYSQSSRGIDRELETFAAAAIRLTDVLREFAAMESHCRQSVTDGLSDKTNRLDLGTYHVDKERMKGVPSKVAKEIAEEVEARVLTYLKRG